MQSNHSAYTAFDKRRIRFSDWIIQYAIVFLLLFSGVLFGSYYAVNQKQEAVFQTLAELHDIAHSSSKLSMLWQSKYIDSDNAISDLISQESILAQRLQSVLSKSDGLPTAPIAFSKFTISEQAQLATNRLEQLGQIALEKSAQFNSKNIWSYPLVLGIGGGWLVLFAYLIWGWRRVLQDRRSSIHFYHAQVDRAQVGAHMTVPMARNDEFGEFARYLSSYIQVLETEKQRSEKVSTLYKAALLNSLSSKLVLNSSREVLTVSEGFYELWVLESDVLSELLGIDAQLTELDGEIVSKSLINGNKGASIKLGRHHFDIRCIEIDLGQEQGYLIEFSKVVLNAEIRVLEATLSLMASDVWDAPIRILDEESPYFNFSRKLERTRQQVDSFLQGVDHFVKERDKEYPKITKLQQLLDWMGANLKSENSEVESLINFHEQLHLDIDTSKHEFLKVREQIEYRFELYEAYLQQLLEWQASQGTWVATVNNGLIDAKEAILNLLSVVHTEPTSASLIEHSVIDLTHDIDTVLASIVESKPLPRELRLEHIKSSESDLMRHLNDVQTRLDALSSSVKKSLPSMKDSLNFDK